MPNIPIKMNKLRTIIRLYEEQTGLKTIAAMARTSRNTVKKYVQKWNSLKMTYEEFHGKSDAELHDLFCVPACMLQPNPRLEELEGLMPDICKELGRKGATTLQQWDKYRQNHPDGYGLTQFRLAIQRYRMITNPSMRMEHKAGDKMFIDYTGDKLWIYPHGESPRQVEVFVAILGCSLLTYVEAVSSQTKEDFISACENAFYYYGGVPQAMIPDNLKAAVTKAGRYESVLNEEFERFAEHYAVTVLPARVRKPKDKSVVENAVKLTYKDIFTRIEHLRCPDLKSLNAAIRSALEIHNHQLLSRRNYSRRSYFEEIERDVLGPLNPIRYQIKKHIMATVGKDGYVRLREDIHYYSVPYIYIGKKLKISYTTSDVEIFDGYTCVACHTRSRLEFKHTTNPEHLSPKQKVILEWSPETFIKQAAEINEDVEFYIRKVLEKKRYVDQANKSCSGILSLARKVGPLRLAALEFVAESKDLFITGPTGTGKSYLATALGNKACQDGYKVLYASTAKLMSQLKIVKVKGSVINDFKRIEGMDLLILDDFGMQALDSQARGILVDIIEDRHQKRSTIINSQVPVKGWYDVIGEKTVTDAVLDRLVHHSLRVELFGESLRKLKCK